VNRINSYRRTNATDLVRLIAIRCVHLGVYTTLSIFLFAFPLHPLCLHLSIFRNTHAITIHTQVQRKKKEIKWRSYISTAKVEVLAKRPKSNTSKCSPLFSSGYFWLSSKQSMSILELPMCCEGSVRRLE